MRNLADEAFFRQQQAEDELRSMTVEIPFNPVLIRQIVSNRSRSSPTGSKVGICCYCETHGNMTTEHLTPISRGGSRHAKSNQALSCGTCNAKKSCLTDAEFRSVMHDPKAIKALVREVSIRLMREREESARIKKENEGPPRIAVIGSPLTLWFTTSSIR